MGALAAVFVALVIVGMILQAQEAREKKAAREDRRQQEVATAAAETAEEEAAQTQARANEKKKAEANEATCRKDLECWGGQAELHEQLRAKIVADPTGGSRRTRPLLRDADTG